MPRSSERVRLETLTIHRGRDTFISHALAGGRSLAEVRDAAGHVNVSITSGYPHVAVDDDCGGRIDLGRADRGSYQSCQDMNVEVVADSPMTTNCP